MSNDRLVKAGILAGLLVLIIISVNSAISLSQFISGVEAEDRRMPTVAVTETQAPLSMTSDQLAKYLESNSNEDGQLWSMLATKLMADDRFEDAAQASARAIELAGASADELVTLGIAITRSNRNYVTDLAKGAFDNALLLEANHPIALYYTGQWQAQQGDWPSALDLWVDILGREDLDAEFRQEVDTSIRVGMELYAREQGFEMPPLPDTGFLSEASNERPSETVSLSEEERVALLEEIASIEESLKVDPKRLEGWKGLALNHARLGDKGKAKEVLRRASMQFLDDFQAVSELTLFYEELGLNEIPVPQE